jgi:hypothetical protein
MEVIGRGNQAMVIGQRTPFTIYGFPVFVWVGVEHLNNSNLADP